jgi:hypothetical protein
VGGGRVETRQKGGGGGKKAVGPVSQAHCPHARALEQGVNCVIFTQQTYSIFVPEMHTCINT